MSGGRDRRGAALLVGVGALLAASAARADAIGAGEACPPGTSPDVTHMGTQCEPSPCPESGECADLDERPRRCRAMRVCRQSHEVFIRTGQLDGYTASRPLVVEVCAPDARCDGHGDRAPTTGEPDSRTITCVEERLCVVEPFPPLRTRGAEPPSAETPEEAAESAPEPEEPEASEEPEATEEPAAAPSGCGCHVAPRGAGVTPLLALGLLLGWRRR
ncbi:MAG: hypothetical protein H6719_19560 [Sandaracinaceae bacterium]|nr:hypothetical protein [Sandaracinaceae bacterium]